MIFLTVGTQLPFDRLVRAVDEALAARVIDDEVVAQIGVGGYRPRHMAWTETLDREAFDAHVARAVALVGHAGTGTIFVALEAMKPLLVMPRLSRLGEHVNDHQVGTARRFGALGHVLVAEDERTLVERLRELRHFVPRPRQPRTECVVARVRAFLDAVAAQRSSRF